LFKAKHRTVEETTRRLEIILKSSEENIFDFLLENLGTDIFLKRR